MASKESHIIVACEESLLSYELFHAYFPLFSYVKLNVKSKKDSSLPKVLNKLSKNPNVSITIVTACSHPQLIEKYLRENVLTETPFSVLYAPLLPVYSDEKAIAQNKKINIVPASTSPPPGYTLIFNHTLSAPKGGWETYAKILWQRLVNIGYFYTPQVKEDCSVEENSTVVISAHSAVDYKKEPDESLGPSTGANAAYEDIDGKEEAVQDEPLGSSVGEKDEEDSTVIVLAHSNIDYKGANAAYEDIDGKEEAAQDEPLGSSVGEKDEEDSTVIVLAHSNIDYKKEQDKPITASKTNATQAHNPAVYINGAHLSAFFSSGAKHMRSYTPSGAKDMKPYLPPSPYATLSYATPPRLKVC